MVVVKANYQQSGWRVMLRELLITLMFLRPAVDAYRVVTSKEDELAVTDPLHEVSCLSSKFIGVLFILASIRLNHLSHHGNTNGTSFC